MREQLIALRQAMARQGVDYYMIPTADFHGSEYVGEHFKCRRYVSGFTGSAGTVLVSQEWAGLWTDGRYFIQAAAQLTDSGIDLCKMGQPGVPTIEAYLEQHMTNGQTLGFDGRVVSAGEYQELCQLLEPKGVKLNGQLDLVGEIWTDRPALSAEPVWELPVKVVGQSRQEKIAQLREAIKKAEADALVLTTLDDIVWLLNIRGNDVACNPVVLSYLAVIEHDLTLFINESVLSTEVAQALKEDGVSFAPYNDVYDYVRRLQPGTAVMIDESKANSAILLAVPEGVVVKNETTPTQLPKSKKNPTEVENMKQAHIKDGAAVCKFMYWLKHNVGKIPMTELSASGRLEQFRAEQEHYLGPSFDPIVSYGAHAAIVHYSATPETDIPLQPESFLLVDTGGQYLEGTTDITRTFALGPVTEEQKRHFTLVLKGNLNLGDAVFRAGASGANLDYIARKPLWDARLDYNHGTGHGVGYLLNVHEGPQSISWQRPAATTPLEVGMVTSNEPGFYLEGQYGIRHENLVVCVEDETNDYGQFLRFDTLTLVPFDLDAVEPSLLTERERQLLNDYHKQIRTVMLPRLTPDEGAWLEYATREI